MGAVAAAGPADSSGGVDVPAADNRLVVEPAGGQNDREGRSAKGSGLGCANCSVGSSGTTA